MSEASVSVDKEKVGNCGAWLCHAYYIRLQRKILSPQWESVETHILESSIIDKDYEMKLELCCNGDQHYVLYLHVIVETEEGEITGSGSDDESDDEDRVSRHILEKLGMM